MLSGGARGLQSRGAGAWLECRPQGQTSDVWKVPLGQRAVKARGAVDKQVGGKAGGPSETLGHTLGRDREVCTPHPPPPVMGTGPAGLGKGSCGNPECRHFF